MSDKIYQTDAEVALENALVNAYFSNLKFLRDCDKELYEKVEGLSYLIDSGEYKPRYELEFLQDEGDFDIYDSQEDRFLYYKKPKKINETLISNTNKDTKSSFGIVSRDIYTTSFELDENAINTKRIQENNESIPRVSHTIKQFKKFFKDDFTKEKEFEYVDKFVFIGSLLGRHMVDIVDKVQAKHYFVHEPSLEIFRLSLFVFDLTILLKYGAFVSFSIMDDEKELESKFYKYLLKSNWSNYLIKFCSTNYNSNDSFELLFNSTINYDPTRFDYEKMLYNSFRNTCEKVFSYKILSFPMKENLNIFEDKPVLYICAGPSLGENIEWVKRYQDLFFIVTIGAAYKKLLKNKIKIDAIITVDSSYELINKLQFDIENVKKIEDVLIFASNLTDERILNRFKKENIFLFDTMSTLKKENKAIQGYSVGEIGYRILIELNAKELFLLGTDLAINQEKGFSHDEESGSGVSQKHDLDRVKSIFEDGSFDSRNDLVQVKGNFTEKVLTTRNFNSSIKFYDEINQTIKKDSQNIYNLNLHGAFFQKTIPTKVQDVNFEKYKKTNWKLYQEDVKKILNKNSFMGLEKEDIEELKKQLNHIKSMKIYLNSFKSFTSFKTFKMFYEQFYKKFILIDEYNNYQDFYITFILYNFYGIITSYIEYCFNTRNLTEEKEKVDKVSLLWIKELNRLIEDYELFLNKVINNGLIKY